MFTGIVEETGRVLERTATDGGLRLRLATSFADLSTGDSVSVSGVCLTVEDHGSGSAGEIAGDDDQDRWFSVFLAAETRDRTYLGELAPGDPVNLERAMPADGRFDGHVVQGHVDGTGAVQAIDEVGGDWRVAFSLPDDLSPYLVEKGSIAVDGISLTVADLDEASFAVAVVPETYRLTTLSEAAVDDPVHLEVDVVAKYVERLLDERA